MQSCNVTEQTEAVDHSSPWTETEPYWLLSVFAEIVATDESQILQIRFQEESDLIPVCLQFKRSLHLPSFSRGVIKG